MPKNETDNFITKCKQIFTPEVNVTELCQKYKLKADGIYLLHRDKQGSVFQEQLITHKPLLITGFFMKLRPILLTCSWSFIMRRRGISCH